MKVLWLAPFPHRSYAGHPAPWLTTLARALSRQPGFDLTVLNWEPALTQPVEEYEQDGIHFVYLKTPTTRQDLLSLYRQRIALTADYLRRYHRQYDVIHVHGSELQYQAAVAGLDRPVLLSVQGIISECLRVLPETLSLRRVFWTLASYYERKYVPGIHEFSCRTNWDKAQVAKLSPGSRIHHNWEMIRPEFFAPATEDSAPEGRPQILFMGGTQIMKGFHETLQAFDAVCRQIPAKLVVVGEQDAEQVYRYVRQAGLHHIQHQDIECRGFQTAQQLRDVFAQSLCLLHPSYIDNSPNSVCEAQVAGLPVVASQVGGVDSLIDDGHTGLLSSLRPQQLADQVLRLHHDPDLSRRLAAQAQVVARTRHDPATILQRALDIYHVIQ